MKCRYCNAEIPEGELYCKRCGREVRIVPDYNPLDEMLTAQIKLGIDGNDTDTKTDTETKTKNNTIDRMQKQKRSSVSMSERERRRRQAAKAAKKKALRKKRRILLMSMAAIFILICAGIYLLYQNSYNGILKKASKAAQTKDYTSAESYYKKAISKDAKKADAYTGLADVYIAQDQTKDATAMFKEALAKQTSNAELYKACMNFYLKTDQNMEIPDLLDSVSDTMLEKLNDYIVNEPEYSLNDSTTYDDVQKLLLTTDASAIYYTTDGTDPSLKSTKYTKEGIQLSEGETTVKAIAVNKKGVPSATSTKTYTVEFPIEDAPAVSPSTGQYEELVQIEVKVPDGYTAYYTLDGTDPTSASKKYTAPIDMPEGETLFKVVLINAKGRASGITTRNYMYEK